MNASDMNPNPKPLRSLSLIIRRVIGAIEFVLMCGLFTACIYMVIVGHTLGLTSLMRAMTIQERMLAFFLSLLCLLGAWASWRFVMFPRLPKTQPSVPAPTTFTSSGNLPSTDANLVPPPPSSVIFTATPAAIANNRKRPITTVLIGINLIVFAFMVLRGASVLEPTAAQIREVGANWGPLTLGPEPWRLLTANYVHVGLLHLAVNLWSLWVIGLLAEKLFRPWTYVLIYTVSGLAGSLASVWWNPLLTSAGASGALFGLVGALISTLYLGNLPIPQAAKQNTLQNLVKVVVLNLVIGATATKIDNSAHIGGLLAGLAVGAALARHQVAPSELRLKWQVGVFTAAAMALAAGYTFTVHTRDYVVYFVQGLDALKDGKYDEAARTLEIANAKKPGDHDIVVQLASAYLRQMDYAKAEGALQQALQLDANDFKCQYNLGFSQLKLGKYDEAIASLNQAAVLDPNDSNVDNALHEAYRLSNRRDNTPSR